MDEFDETLHYHSREWRRPWRTTDTSQDVEMETNVMPMLDFTPVTPDRFNRTCPLNITLMDNTDVVCATLLGHDVFQWEDRNKDNITRLNIVFEARGKWHRYVALCDEQQKWARQDRDEEVTQDVFNVMQGGIPRFRYATNATILNFWVTELSRPIRKSAQDKVGWIRYEDLQGDRYVSWARKRKITKPVQWATFDDPILVYLSTQVALVQVPTLLFEAGRIFAGTGLDAQRCVGAMYHGEWKVFDEDTQLFKPHTPT